MLAAGVHIWEYLPRVLHAKTVVVDHDWATVGTANFDYRSFFLNDEMNLWSMKPDSMQSSRRNSKPTCSMREQ